MKLSEPFPYGSWHPPKGHSSAITLAVPYSESSTSLWLSQSALKELTYSFSVTSTPWEDMYRYSACRPRQRAVVALPNTIVFATPKRRTPNILNSTLSNSPHITLPTFQIQIAQVGLNPVFSQIHKLTFCLELQTQSDLCSIQLRQINPALPMNRLPSLQAACPALSSTPFS